MKIKAVLISLLFILFCSCSSPKYLPGPNQLDVNKNGSYIKLYCKTTHVIKGELIAVGDYNLVVLTEATKECISVPINNVKRFKLRYAEPIRYWWTIPIYTVSTISHGFFLLVTAPINLIVTIAVSASGSNAYKYSDLDLNSEKLRMFARFPQGIPEDLSLGDIK